MAAINPYLTFNGRTEEAFNFYKSVFGGEFTTVMRFKDAPGDASKSEEQGNKIMHVSLPIGSAVLMGSDPPPQMDVNMGNNISISVDVDSTQEADRIYNALAAGGKNIMPMANAFWGSYFGMLIDKFDINWMVSCAKAKE